MLATLVIFLREGVEASMIIAILLAYLNRIGRREHFRDVFVGVGAALLLATAGGIAAYLTIRSYDGSRVQTIFETVTYLLAATVLTYMTFWMRKHARSLSEDSAVGDVLHSSFGYADAPTPLQMLICAGYLAVVVLVYLGVRARLAARAHGPQAAAR